jgi:hypothetical protein
VRTAQNDALRPGGGEESVNDALGHLLVELGPVYEELVATAIAQPTGPVGVVLDYVRLAFHNAAQGRPDHAQVSLIIAARASFRLMPAEVLGTEPADQAR